MGSPPYKAAMSSTRFAFLINSLRFDNPDTRQERRRTDRFAPVRSIWDSFIERCRWMYTPGENLTIDEQLLAFRGRAVFRMYIPKKTAKYGLKLILCCDNKSKYLLGAIPYVGKQEPPPQGDLSLGHYYVRQLTRPYHQSNRNVTVDNWFTSIPLAMDLQSNCGLTLVGTIKSNKKEIPSQMANITGCGSCMRGIHLIICIIFFPQV
ncbi:hypothetical protein Pcinc_002021 [Petrolisthes cinctipes]|uniref:PiggyBac transposable element-derived protein domain-containing protein n=1 Tax=Petrolisthes cinctipes TaxID=88211 RepID=A0AAE1L3D9_PETCI|nr:hypothetical protein Pcinc_002021 [Petrolisthes cinctipes]